MGHQQCQKANKPSHICSSRSKGRPQNMPAPGHTHGLHLVFQLQCWAHTQNADISFRGSHNYTRSIHIRGLCLQNPSAKADKGFVSKIQEGCFAIHPTNSQYRFQELTTNVQPIQIRNRRHSYMKASRKLWKRDRFGLYKAMESYFYAVAWGMVLRQLIWDRNWNSHLLDMGLGFPGTWSLAEYLPSSSLILGVNGIMINKDAT